MSATVVLTAARSRAFRRPARRMPLPRLAVTAALVGAATSLTGCAADVTIADPRQPEVLAERNRIIRLLATDLDDRHTPAVCQVKVLRIEAPTSWARASCSMSPDAAGVRAAWATFIRVDAGRVTYTGDGSAYEPSLRAAFPPDLAEWALAHPDGL